MVSPNGIKPTVIAPIFVPKAQRFDFTKTIQDANTTMMTPTANSDFDITPGSIANPSDVKISGRNVSL